jgi:murein DD-endopeptidase MepM/ murein hydrolase activator NlpD
MPEGSAIPAAAPGRVLRVGWDDGYGNWCDVQHPIHVTRYAHMLRVEVTEGTQVLQGQRLGGAGSTGLSTGTHLHFEIRDNGNPIDPAILLRVEDLP